MTIDIQYTFMVVEKYQASSVLVKRFILLMKNLLDK
jgi:hypothetical protein